MRTPILLLLFAPAAVGAGPLGTDSATPASRRPVAGAPAEIRTADREPGSQWLGADGEVLPFRSEAEVRPYLDPLELKAFLARRDALVEHFQALIDERGEDAVLH